MFLLFYLPSLSFLFFFYSLFLLSFFFFFFFNDTATTEIYTLSLHDALPISQRLMVDLRFHQSRAAWVVKAVFILREKSRRPPAQPLRSAARPGAPLYLAAFEDRQEHHCRPARQDRGKGLLPLKPQAGGALPSRGGRTGAPARRRRRHATARHRAGLSHAAEADLQPSLPVAGRWRMGRGGQRQARASSRHYRGDCGAAGESAGLHSVPRDDGPARGVPGLRVRARRSRPARRNGGQEAQGAGAPVPGGRQRPILRALAQGRRRRPQPHGAFPCHPFRPLVEPRRGKPGYLPPPTKYKHKKIY